MMVVKDKKNCEICGKKEAVVYCDGCNKPLCEDCRKFELWSYGCGSIIPKVFCPLCHDDIVVNPWGGKSPDNTDIKYPDFC